MKQTAAFRKHVKTCEQCKCAVAGDTTRFCHDGWNARLGAGPPQVLEVAPVMKPSSLLSDAYREVLISDPVKSQKVLSEIILSGVINDGTVVTCLLEQLVGSTWERNDPPAHLSAQKKTEVRRLFAAYVSAMGA